jgi:tetratricopeptide (TPR) repeat protein
MKRLILAGALLVAGAAAVMAQPTGAAPAQAPAKAAPSGPHPKSQAELTALQAMLTANQGTDVDVTIKACEDVRSNFPDTDFKELSLNIEAKAYQKKGDWIRAQILSEEALKLNPKSYEATVELADLITQHTGERDLDRDEKLDKAVAYAKQTIDLITASSKPNPAMTDDQWADAKKQYIGEAYHDIALCASVRKQWDAAIAAFKSAVDNDPQPAYRTQMADALQKSGKNDDAMTMCDGVLATPNLHPAIQNACNNIKKAATAAKASAGK